jgi:hypothetical protein
LLAQDFWEATRKEFQEAALPTGTKFDQRRDWVVSAKSSHTYHFQEWYDRAKCQTKFFCILYGAEHEPSRLAALDRLHQLHKEREVLYDLEWIKRTWDGLWWRFGEELRVALRALYKDLGTENPSEEQLTFYALAPGADGAAKFRLPNTFDLDDPRGYFQLERMGDIEFRRQLGEDALV